MTKADYRNCVTVRLFGLVLALALTFAADSSWGNARSSRPVFEGEHTYQARGGDIRFTLSGDLQSQPEMRACLCWKSTATAERGCPTSTCSADIPVRWIREIQEPPSVVYAVTIPRGLTESPPGAEQRLFGVAVPVAELTIFTGDDSKSGWKVTREVGVTSVTISAVAAFLAVVFAGAFLYKFAKYLGVPGPEKHNFLLAFFRGFSVPLRLISTANGWASLSKFQILLWTFVVGAGAIYVMSLTGSLIAISGGTLALLGIAGAATVLSEVKGNQASQAVPTLAPPGKPADLALLERPSETEIVVDWSPPPGSEARITYLVQYEETANQGVWYTVCHIRRSTRQRIVGLSPDTSYQVRVLAANEAGTGTAATLVTKTVPTTQQNQTPSVTGLKMQDGRTGTSIPLVWDKATGVNIVYVLEKRPHDGDAGWSPVVLANTSNSQATVAGLISNTVYDFRVRDNDKPEAWSDVTTISTGIRTPRWSDIVTDTDRPAQIDVTRVQMLFFTVISALFVALNIVDAGTIPEIDPTYVTLMGISNGVYVTAKFVRV